MQEGKTRAVPTKSSHEAGNKAGAAPPAPLARGSLHSHMASGFTKVKARTRQALATK